MVTRHSRNTAFNILKVQRTITVVSQEKDENRAYIAAGSIEGSVSGASAGSDPCRLSVL